MRITSTAICGSDLHLYELFGPFLDKGDILGHEPMGVVVEVGSGVTRPRGRRPRRRPVQHLLRRLLHVPPRLQSQCETTQVREYGSGAALFGYTKLYGQVPGGQAEYLRVPLADYNHIRVGTDLPDDRYLFLSDILPTAWQGVEYANVPEGGTLAVMGLGPVGQFAARIGVHLGYRVLAVEPVPERRAMAERHGVQTLRPHRHDRRRAARPDRGARGGLPSSTRSAWRRTATPGVKLAQQRGRAAARPARAAADGQGRPRPARRRCYASIDLVRRGGTVSLSGVYAGEADSCR